MLKDTGIYLLIYIFVFIFLEAKIQNVTFSRISLINRKDKREKIYDPDREKEEKLGEMSFEFEKAYSYIDRRFKRDARMSRLNLFEHDFAQRLFNMIGPDSCIVDVPCGSGRFFDIFSGASNLILIDLSANMLQVAAQKIGTSPGVKLMQGNVCSMSLPDNCADLCFTMRLFHHFKDDSTRLAALKELARVSKRYVALSFYNKHCFRYYWRKMLCKKIRGNYITFEHISRLAAQYGLKPVERYPKTNFAEQQCLVLFEKAPL